MTEFKDGKHFAKIAGSYDALRTTDSAPVGDIVDMLMRVPPPQVVVDVGCGTGRYSFKLLQYLPEMRMVGVDPSENMMSEFLAHKSTLPEDVARRVDWEVCTAEDMASRFIPYSLDAITCFNAIHWFSVGRFMLAVKHLLKPGGRLFVYTRTQAQNAKTIWGQCFPHFVEKETRLLRDEEIRMHLQPGLKLIDEKHYAYERTHSLKHLVSLALHKHYSTFELYGEDEFIEAVASFVEDVGLTDVQNVTWTDRNVLYVVEKL